MSALPSSRKTHSEKHKQIFRQLLKELPNKSCVDCKSAQHPRWASWNLGCFICIRCSGIHRSMGTHISRVKSVDLDVWTDEQVESMIKWGNEKCNLFWEAKLPENYVPDGSKIENFIRTKYDMKKWAASARVPDPMSISRSSVVASNESVSSSAPVVPAKDRSPLKGVSAQGTQKHRVSAPTASLLDDDFGAFSSSASDLSSASVTPQPIKQSATFPSRTPTGSSNSAIKNNLPSASPATPSAPSPRVNDVRGDLKKSILSLYSSPSSSTSSISHQQQFPQNSLSQQSSSSQNFSSIASSPSHTLNSRGPAQQNSTSDLSNSLLGLNFGGNSTVTNSGSQKTTPAFKASPSPSVRSQNSPSVRSQNSPPKASQWANEWNDSSSSVNQWAAPAYNGTSTSSSVLSAGFHGTFGDASTVKATTAENNTGLDDDLFKNVWG